MNNMRETLINQLTKEEYDLIVSLGKVRRNFHVISSFLKLSHLNQRYYTIYTHTYNGIKRNGYHFTIS